MAVGRGGTYKGYKHRRLRKLGNGVHELKRILPPGVVSEATQNQEYKDNSDGEKRGETL